MRRPHKTSRREPRASWLERNRPAVAGVLTVLALSIRMAYFATTSDTPIGQMHKWRQTDMHYYAAWGSAIAAGDWRSASLPLPMHRWHRDVAARYWSDHPAEKASVTATSRDPDAVLWARWMRLPQFYQDPLYAYLLATIESVGGEAVSVLRIAQLAAGVLTILLIWTLTRQFFGDVVAAVAGGAAVLSGPLLFYELLLLRDSLIVFAGLAVIWLLTRVLTRGPFWFVLVGLAVGLACLLKSTFLLLSVGILMWTVVGARQGNRTALLRVATYVLGCVIGLAPLVARNTAVNVNALAVASSGPLTFVAANSPSAMPDVGFGIDVPILASFLGSTDGTWKAAISAAFRGQTLMRYLGLEWRKWDRVWHWYEIPNNENFYFAREQLPVLRLLPVTFWLCGPFAAIGMLLTLPRWRHVWPLLLLVGVTLTPLLAFYVLGRFRIALFAAVIPFAAFAAVEIIRSVRMARRGRALLLTVCVLLVGMWTGRPLAADQVLIRTSDWILPWSVEYETRVYGALDAKDLQTAADAYVEFFQYLPTDTQIVASKDPRLPAELADMRVECARILQAAGRRSEAEAQLASARHLLSLQIRR